MIRRKATLTLSVCTVLLLLLLQQVDGQCVDDNAQIAQLGTQQGRTDLNACIDVIDGCKIQNHLGDSIREMCCQTCSDFDVNKPGVPTQLPPPFYQQEPMQIFLLAGQSECSGQAGVSELQADTQGYPELQGEIPGVWFAGYASPAAADRFFIAPLAAGRDRSLFGPEISFGERIHAVTGKPTLIMKYCLGGSNVHSHWNPFNHRNTWDTSADDGTAQWLATNGGLDFNTKKTQFKNMVYTIRRTTETLTNAGIPYEWAGIVWVQGQADVKNGDPVWKTFGENTARVWNGFRKQIGRNVPIIDTGANTHNQLRSGKEYATQLVKGCLAKNVEFALASNDDTSSDCLRSASASCFDSPNMHLNTGPFLFYGYDPAFPSAQRLCDARSDSSCKEFEWYRQYPTNLHSGYEGMILKGRMLANAYIREFTDYTLPSSYLHQDPAALFPWSKCDEGTLPAEYNYCWIDYRDESLMIQPSSGELCSYSNNIIIDDNHGPYYEDDVYDNSGSTGQGDDDDPDDGDDGSTNDNIFDFGDPGTGGGQHGGLSDTSSANDSNHQRLGMVAMVFLSYFYFSW